MERAHGTVVPMLKKDPKSYNSDLFESGNWLKKLMANVILPNWARDWQILTISIECVSIF